MPEILLDEATHRYTVDGVEMPSVTQILKFCGLIQSKFYTEESRQFGTAVHKACEYLDAGILKRSTLHPRVAPRVEAWERFKNESHFTISEMEKKLYHPQYKFCGTLDREGFTLDTDDVVDIKTGVVQPWTALQLAGYDLMLPKTEKPRRRIGVQLKDDGTYKVSEFRDPRDHNQFLACVSNFYWAQNHGIKGEK